MTSSRPTTMNLIKSFEPETENVSYLRDESNSIILNGLQTIKSHNKLLSRANTDISLWNTYEKVFLAALDTYDIDVCKSILDDLDYRFPDSQRVLALKGLLFEVEGQTKSASDVYDDMAELNELNVVSVKRKVALLMSSGKLNEAIKSLVVYLEDFQADADAWKQLALLYIEGGDMRHAVFCLEEVLLHNPHGYLGHIALAEALYTLGQEVENVVLARKYYSQSLLTKKRNARSLFGLAVTTKALSNFVNSTKKNDARQIVDVETNRKLMLAL